MKIKTESVLSTEESAAVIGFVLNNFDNDQFFKNNGNARRYCSVTNVDTPVTDYLKTIRSQKFKEIGIDSFLEEPVYGIFIGVNGESGFVHPHRDSTIDGYEHFRLNFLVSKPDGGGMPVVDGKEYSIEEGQSWINIASKWAHMSTPVVGTKNRIVLSLGGYVKISDVDLVVNLLNKEI
jgi:hypothetical protein